MGAFPAIIALLALPGNGSATPTSEVSVQPKRAHSNHWDAGRMALNVVNDAFGSLQDEGYTSGLRITTQFAPFIGTGVRGWFRGDLARRTLAEYWGATAAFDIYTPTNLEARTAEQLANDRPYAGFFGLSFFDTMLFRGGIEPSGYTIMSLSLDGGFVGPSTRTEQIQRSWHAWARRTFNRQVTPRDPKGWEAYQIQDAFLIGVRGRVESDGFRVSWGDGRDRSRHGGRGGLRVSGLGDCDLGTIRVECDLGTTLRLGWLPDIALEGIQPLNTWDATYRRRPRLPLFAYAYIAGIARFTLYNAFLDGPLGSNGPTQDRRTFGAEAQAGFLFRLGHFEMLYRHIVQTREIEDLPPDAQRLQQLGQVILSATWN